jgi:uncharacterized protein YdeI (YjbR/CyaY-like superfamily)
MGASRARRRAPEGGAAATTPVFFASAALLRAWLEAHQSSARELWIGFYRKDSGQSGLTYAEALDQALAFGWIDGVRKKVDATRYVQRFTPRKPNSFWSVVNIARAHELGRQGLMTSAGLRVFEDRDEARTHTHQQLRRSPVLDAAALKTFTAKRRAWAFFTSQPPGYQRVMTWWVVSAKLEGTRRRRLATLMALSERSERSPLFRPAPIRTATQSSARPARRARRE